MNRKELAIGEKRFSERNTVISYIPLHAGEGLNGWPYARHLVVVCIERRALAPSSFQSGGKFPF